MEKTWPERIKRILKMKKITPPELAKLIGCHRNQVYSWMRGDYRPNAKRTEALMMIEFELAKSDDIAT